MTHRPNLDQLAAACERAKGRECNGWFMSKEAVDASFEIAHHAPRPRCDGAGVEGED